MSSTEPSVTAVDLTEFRPGRRFYAAFGSLCIVILAAALDATSLSTALPVSQPPIAIPNGPDSVSRLFPANSAVLQSRRSGPGHRSY